MIKFAICDDQPAMVRELEDRLGRYMAGQGETPYSVDRFRSGGELLESGCDYDALFLDIRMEGAGGIETARELRRRGCSGLLVFVTALRECALDAFQLEACDYLVKPLEEDRFRWTMDRLLRALGRREDKSILVRQGNACRVIPLSRLLYCEVQGRKVYLHQTDGTVTGYYDRLEALERRLDGRFFRCHRSYLVNLDHLLSSQGGRAALSQGAEVPVSRLRQRELAQALLRRMKERGC